jgi:hypothetical protein
MTEAEWLTCRNSLAMLRSIGDRASDRKLRLFQVGCCRRMWSLVSDERWREAVLVAERYADKEATDKTRVAARNCLYDFHNPIRPHTTALHAVEVANRRTMERRTFLYYGGSAHVVAEAAATADPSRRDHVYAVAYTSEYDAAAHLVRDIFVNPFQPVLFSPEWRTDTAMSLARQMYESREFGAMPILADALQDAGCDEAAVLDHCRGPGPHVRGCWVVDLVLGKE